MSERVGGNMRSLQVGARFRPDSAPFESEGNWPARSWNVPIQLGFFSLVSWSITAILLGRVPDQMRVWVSWSSAGLAVSLIRVAACHVFHVTRSWTRYVSFRDLVDLIRACGTACVAVLLIQLPMTNEHMTASVVVIDAGVALGILALVRAWPRFRRDVRREALRTGAPKSLIWGTGDAEVALLHLLEHQATAEARVAGWVAADRRLVGKRIAGIPVVAEMTRWRKVVRALEIEEVFVVSGAYSGENVRRLLREAKEVGIRVRVLPSYAQVVSGDVQFTPRDVRIEDLLGRAPVQLQGDVLSKWLSGRTVLITGGAGSIGSELARQVLAFGPSKLILVDRSEHGVFEAMLEHQSRDNVLCCLADVNDRARMEQLFAAHRPHIVFHAAAFKHVPILETHPREAVQNIVGATVQLAQLSCSYGVHSFVLISTDKAVAPASVMGACKRVAERYVQSIADEAPCRMVTVRFGNVLDSAGSVVPIFRRQIATGRPITVTHPEMQRFFMTIPEASQLVMHAGAMGVGGEIFVLKMGDPVRIVDLACDMIRLSGLTPGDDVPIEFTGLRPGEKLSEQLADVGERLGETSHPGILVVQASPLPCRGYAGGVESLLDQARGSSSELLGKIRRLVPEYSPQTKQSGDVAPVRSGELRLEPSSAVMSKTSV